MSEKTMKAEYQTYVVKFDGQGPSVKANMQINGGKLQRVSFNDQLEQNDQAREKIEYLLEEFEFMERIERESLLNEILKLI
tara:strand:+ start:531 stop:773 length:243 start_codon:yes stop_codon:yes gene_type:complete